MRLVVVTYNIRAGGIGRGTQIVGLLSPLDPDVVILQEAIDPDVVTRIGRELGLPTVIVGRSGSVAGLTRVPIEPPVFHRAPTGRAVLEMRLESPAVRLFGVHLTAGLSQRGERRRIREVAHLLELASADGESPTMLLGDFNAVAQGDAPFVRRMPLWIRALLRFDGGVRTEAMTALGQAGFVDAFRASNPGLPGLTLPAGSPSVRLDYILVQPSLVGRLSSCRIGEPGQLAAAASDHLPVVAEFDLDDGPAVPGVDPAMTVA